MGLWADMPLRSRIEAPERRSAVARHVPARWRQCPRIPLVYFVHSRLLDADRVQTGYLHPSGRGKSRVMNIEVTQPSPFASVQGTGPRTETLGQSTELSINLPVPRIELSGENARLVLSEK